jgi:hypothetical protein
MAYRIVLVVLRHADMESPNAKVERPAAARMNLALYASPVRSNA